MGKAISAADANRNFSTVLREVRDGATYVVTSHGRPVARILPFRSADAVGVAARDALLARLESTSVLDVGRWTRDELYDRPADRT